MKTTTTALAAAGMLALASVMAPTGADAGCRNCGLAAGIIGGIAAGAIIGGAIANSAYPAYAVQPGYAPYPAYAAARAVVVVFMFPTSCGVERPAIVRLGG